ncbi:MAG: TonB-dependent receptor [Epsilonproteobacteria bacterium]|nr:TonB-dependent receptor [Campylobacterota bacterium]
MKQYILTLLSTLSLLYAQNTVNLEDDFLKSLDDVSEIATKTKLNIDETPSFVTILHSKKLKKFGVKNVFEALAFVPGVQLQKESSGVSTIVFRGVTQKGEVKLMVDGVTINNSYRGSIYYYLDFPIELVKRIEVIRGSGSILYGSNAISGVINIITNISQEDIQNSIFVSKGSYDGSKIGTYLSTELNGFKLALDAYSQKNNKTIYVSANPANQGGDSDRHLDDYSFGVNITNKKLSLLTRIKKSDIGNAYGIIGMLDKDRDKFQNKNTSIYTQLSYNTNINQNNQINFMATYNRYIQEVDTIHPRNFAINTLYKENSYLAEINLISKSIKDNELLIGLKYEYAKTLQSQWQAGSTQITPISKPDLSRKTLSIYLNNTYSLTQNFNLSTGLRYDNYDDFGNTFNPNIGLVYKLNPEISFKALYSHSFRAPSWVELTSNPILKAEKSNSIEVGAIYKPNQQHTIRFNVYSTRINDMITKSITTQRYIQSSKNSFLGAEVEYIYTPNNQLEFNLFASHIEPESEDKIDLPNVANLLASASLTYQTSAGLNFGSVLRYTSSPNRDTGDYRTQLTDSFVFDQTISYEYKDFTIALNIKNLFNDSIYYPLPNSRNQQDFDDGGREFMLNLALDF